MRASQFYYSTLKETPRDAEIISHQLMLRAGMIRKLGSGLYTWLPLGLKVLRNVEQIVREEMNRAGAIELLMPAVQPAELWQETGRWETFGGQLLTMFDSNKREYCFGPTHEEVITDLVRNNIRSYKQLPLTLYQIQTKFRDEIRPRFGVMRAREFLMKDAYSFHADDASLQKTYQDLYTAYSNIFDRLGLKYRAVEADTGAIGGAVSHEFQVLAESGEDLIVYSDQSNYAANIEQATSLAPEISNKPPLEPMQKIATPDTKTIDQVSKFLNLEPQQIIKTLIVAGTKHPYVALVLRGNDELNPIKATKHPLIQSPLKFIDTEEIERELKIPVGFIGPIDLSIPVIVDQHARALSTFICGANHQDYHYINVSWERDLQCNDIADLRNVNIGDPSPDGKGKLNMCRGIEVGHIFQLGTKYSTAMQATITAENGKNMPMIMGTYGIGISRVVAATIEQHHDERGMLWPTAIAPFKLVIIPINAKKSASVQQTTEELYLSCQKLGIDILLDDRDERPGVLFAENDLIGIPHRIVISEKLLEQQVVEYKARNAENSQNIALNEVLNFIRTTLHV
jgi:prolyl-tRNA synthetase